jgi:hypothetical protein
MIKTRGGPQLYREMWLRRRLLNGSKWQKRKQPGMHPFFAFAFYYKNGSQYVLEMFFWFLVSLVPSPTCLRIVSIYTIYAFPKSEGWFIMACLWLIVNFFPST